jgi:hypothetical protein
MARKSLFARGPFLMGLTMVVIGILGFASLLVVPAGLPAEAMRRIGEVAGTFGGAFMGAGAVFMVIGFRRWKRQGEG